MKEEVNRLRILEERKSIAKLLESKFLEADVDDLSSGSGESDDH